MRTRIGGLIKKHRERCGFSQKELAGNAGCSASYLHDVERGFRLPSNNLVFSIMYQLEMELREHEFYAAVKADLFDRWNSRAEAK